MSEETRAYIVEMPLHYYFEIGLDPASLPDHRVKQMCAPHAARTCESLFWVVRQLGNLVQNEGWVYSESDLADALQHIGELGKAMAQAAGENAEFLEHIADRLHKQAGEGREEIANENT